MYTVNHSELLKALREGTTLDELAQKFSDALNAAEAALKEEEEKRKIQEAEKKEKARMAQVIIEDINYFLESYYKDKIAPIGITGEELVHVLDHTGNISFKVFNQAGALTDEVKKLYKLLGI